MFYQVYFIRVLIFLFYVLYSVVLAYLKDSNAAAHSVDSDIFQSSDSSICALQERVHCHVRICINLQIPFIVTYFTE